MKAWWLVICIAWALPAAGQDAPASESPPEESPTVTTPADDAASGLDGASSEVDAPPTETETEEPAETEPAETAPAETEPAETEPAPVKPTSHQVLVMKLTAIDVAEGEAKLVGGLVADALSRHEVLNVMTAADIERLVELEGQKQAIGCEESSCLAEVAGAMGADFVVFGQVGKLGELYLVQLNLYDAEEGRSVGREDLRTDKIEEVALLIEPRVTRLVLPLLPEGAEEASRARRPDDSVIAPSNPDGTVDQGGIRWLMFGGIATIATGLIGSVGTAGLAYLLDAQLGAASGRLVPPDVAYFGALVSGAAAAGLFFGGWVVGGGLIGLSFAVRE